VVKETLEESTAYMKDSSTGTRGARWCDRADMPRASRTRPDTRSISSRWWVGRGSSLRGRGSQSVGRGCILGGQGLLCSEITNTANFAASKISCFTQTDIQTDRPRDTPSYRVA